MNPTGHSLSRANIGWGKHPDRGTLAKGIIFTFVSVCFFIYFYFYPTALDDYMFLNGMKEQAIAAGHPGSLWHGLWGEAVNRYYEDNGRLANTVFPSMLLVPRIIPVVISIAAFIVTYILIIKLSHAKSLFLFCVATFGVCVLMPWHDNLFVLMYQINYVWTGALMLVALYLFLDRRKHSAGLSFTAGLILGLSHEGFTIPLLCAALAIIMIKRHSLNTTRIALIAGMIAGTIWIVSAPATWTKSAILAQQDAGRLSLLRVEWLYYLYIMIWIVCAVQRRTRVHAMSDLALICLIAGAMVIPFHIFSYRMRAIYPLCMLAIIGLTYLGQQLPRHPISNILKNSLIIIACAFLAVHLSLAAVYIFKLHAETSVQIDIQEQNASRDTTLFVPLKYDYQLPWLTLCKANCIYRGMSGSFYDRYSNIRHHVILPEELHGYRGEADHIIPGGADARYFKGFIIVDADLANRLTVVFAYTPHTYESVRFTGADNKEYALIIPTAAMRDVIRKIQEVRINE